MVHNQYNKGVEIKAEYILKYQTNCQGELKKYFFFILTNDVQNGR